MTTRLTNLRINEVSVVDAGAIPQAHMKLWKRRPPGEPMKKSLAEVLKSLSAEDRSVVEAAISKEKQPPEEEPLPEAVRKRLQAAEESAAELKKRLNAEIEKSETKEAIEKARTDFAKLGKPEEVGPLLRKIRKGLPTEDADAVEALLTKANAAQTQAGKVLGATVGKRGQEGTGAGGSAWDAIQKRAKELVKSGQAKTMEQAVVQVTESDPDLVEQYEAEKGD